jgi:hypothetical protein
MLCYVCYVCYYADLVSVQGAVIADPVASAVSGTRLRYVPAHPIHDCMWVYVGVCGCMGGGEVST